MTQLIDLFNLLIDYVIDLIQSVYENQILLLVWLWLENRQYSMWHQTHPVSEKKTTNPNHSFAYRLYDKVVEWKR